VSVTDNYTNRVQVFSVITQLVVQGLSFVTVNGHIKRHRLLHSTLLTLAGALASRLAGRLIVQPQLSGILCLLVEGTGLLDGLDGGFSFNSYASP
jgi:hypothetical protein